MRTCPGDHLGLDFPTDAASLGAAGPDFLTAALRRSGVLAGDDAVVAVDELTEFRGGSTGRKALLTVSYRSTGRLPRELFVKFSRDFDDPARDLGRSQMAMEVRFALLTRAADFPIAVPRCLYADYHAASGSGLLITDRITFGENGIEKQYDKCADYSMPDPLHHYEALFGALGRLAGSDKAGLLGAGTDFAVDMRSLSVGERPPLTADHMVRRVDLLGQFATRHPSLLPADVVTPEFLARLSDDVAVIPGRVDALWERLGADADYVALCHWNANVDNAWFWRDGGRLGCGLLDWGCVGRMNLAMAVWGALCSAETSMWDRDFEHLLRCLVAEFTEAGGPAIDAAVLREHVLAYVAIMGTTWLLDVPGFLLKALPEKVGDRFDPAIADSEQIRSRLLMMTNFLNLWAMSDTEAVLSG
ncbi:hypothetical protein [Mycolicibacterium austroafricanum]|uniref:Aminoglycoside phosphotransferase domain-containing protein n=1 Tax=Mycolicibacterium austroafricanum TaxID=39687 RepID=A0ABT8HI78_MYCAO|nr:hypothetical protein [Mycolicibacterium austroafricanum]MDN4520482.1 hypothetical protein [Mycolicibacterium austroafricanum]PQP50074.1 hypothetical protein C6A88_10670 [Mycolicibacterium austroafricanum]QRZ07646.1 hypothetical protein JN090_03550 [Mycolicibacterium austroafricanum]QZT60397.1 hypothetical protein JN085_15150 [Mycolicibacterium austroafricanum]QZT69309.1 hypothetical protein JN086_04555 [Mycolicibacterium austroafricanum]